MPMLHPGNTDFIRDYIINWNLWLILESEKYASLRGGDAEMVAGLKDIVYGILGGMARLKNEFGLDADMPGWVFVWDEFYVWSFSRIASMFSSEYSISEESIRARLIRVSSSCFGWAANRVRRSSVRSAQNAMRAGS